MRVLVAKIAAVLIAVFLLFSGARSASQMNSGTVEGYQVRKWTTADGLPQNTVTSIVHGKDGFLWLGTFGGLARFDGLRFIVFNSANTPGFKSNRVLSLYQDRFGTLWIGTDSGEIYTLSNGEIKEFGASLRESRKRIRDFVEDGSGYLYIASDTGLERYSYSRDGKISENSRSHLTKSPTSSLSVDGSKRVWVRVDVNYFVVVGDSLVPGTQIYPDLPAETVKIAFGGGSGLAANSSSLRFVEPGGGTDVMQLKYSVHGNYLQIAYLSGAFWFQMGSGLYRIERGSEKRYDLGAFVTAGSRKVFIDRESNIWLATNQDGLVRLSKRRINLLSEMTGREIGSTYSVVEHPDGSIWIAAGDLIRLKAGESKTFPGFPVPGRRSLIKTIAIGPDGAVWAGGDTGVFRFNGRDLEPVREFSAFHINAIFFDRKGGLWIGGQEGLWRRAEDRFVHITASQGLSDDRVQVIRDTSDGRMFVGTIRGLNEVDYDSAGITSVKISLDRENIRDIFDAGNGDVWIASYGSGIFRYRKGELVSITEEQGLHDDFISRILLGDDNQYWILGNHGIMAIGRASLDEVADGQERRLTGAILNADDGMPSSEGNGAHQPAGYKTSDGRLWFPMIDDMVVVDPKSINRSVPSVVVLGAFSRKNAQQTVPVEYLLRGGRTYKASDGSQNLEIEYTGLSLGAPERMRFYYKLEGLDADWIDAGTRRTAFYPYLPPGNYRFLVRAVDVNGVSTKTDAALRIIVPAPFYSTWWFILLMSVTLIAVVIVAFRMRVSRLRERSELQEEFARRLIDAHETERQRIAVELHDGLGHYLLAIRNQAMLGMAEDGTREKANETLGEISDTAGGALEETRRIVRNLAPEHLKSLGLTVTVKEMLEQVEESSGIRIDSNIEDIDNLFDPATQMNIFRILQECLNNVVKHSGASKAKITIARNGALLEIGVVDNGKGFDPEKILHTTDPSGGFGLKHLSERVKIAGGTLAIDSSPGKGTRVRISI